MEKYSKYTTDDFVMDGEFRAWALGKNSGDESEQWPVFLERHPEKKAEIDQAIFVLQGFENLSETSASQEQIKRIWANVRTQAAQKRSLRLIHFMRYAAIFIIALLIGAWGYKTVYSVDSVDVVASNEIFVPQGERSEIVLYDGTKVWLNSGTRFRFPTSFSKNERRIFLDGEAFFDVTRKDNGKPFIVSTPGKVDIKVLGTRFNVNAYAEDKNVTATLEDGEILAVNNVTHEEADLLPGDQLSMDISTGESTQRKVDTDLYTSWKENLLRFQDASFEEVVKKMERWYDVDITVERNLNVTKLYTMTIKTESLREMLNLLSYTTPMNYEINEDQVFISHR
ncbi:FecR family protein [Mangrovibacterium diazotrophicum]|uniref:FecR family protein n=1 Tax=Mangrovibacterium diazotrophicum TaxID=1261403 RepID=A0A419W5F7_9BACT|nr:FecR family protein [Mangrovibacterium diazotrophicum]RKD90666.1 FecR family protein [Mangrovibacterium diazotrophicum]